MLLSGRRLSLTAPQSPSPPSAQLALPDTLPWPMSIVKPSIWPVCTRDMEVPSSCDWLAHPHIVDSYPTNLSKMGNTGQVTRTIVQHIPTPRKSTMLPHCPRKLQEKPGCQRLFRHSLLQQNERRLSKLSSKACMRPAVNRKTMEQGPTRKDRSPPPPIRGKFSHQFFLIL